jgi:hypothetical protein
LQAFWQRTPSYLRPTSGSNEKAAPSHPMPSGAEDLGGGGGDS